MRDESRNQNLAQLGNVEPAALFPGFEAQLRKLNTFGALQEVPRERIVLHDMLEEELPLHLEGVVVGVVGGDTGPAILVINRAVDVGIPDAARCGGMRLCFAITESCNGASLGSINLEGQQILTVDAELK